jgi:hypothetical protein
MSDPVVTHAAPSDESSTLPGEGRSFLLDEVIPGTAAGIIGGAGMMLLYMGGTWVFGSGPWDGPKILSSLYYRHLFLHQIGTAGIVLGLVIFFGVSCGLALAFAMALPRQMETMFATFALAILYGMTVYALMVYLVAPWAAPLFATEVVPALSLVRGDPRLVRLPGDDPGAPRPGLGGVPARAGVRPPGGARATGGERAGVAAPRTLEPGAALP